MHLKIVIIDKHTVTSGSYNYTGKATLMNDENLIIITDNKVGEDFTKEFDAMWCSSNYVDYK